MAGTDNPPRFKGVTPIMLDAVSGLSGALTNSYAALVACAGFLLAGIGFWIAMRRGRDNAKMKLAFDNMSAGPVHVG